MTKITSYYPVVATSNVAAAAEFFERHLGFRSLFVADWYVHLQRPDHPEVNLALLDAEHETVPSDHRTPAKGMLLNFEVDDVAAEYTRLMGAGIDLVVPLRDEPWGQRHFILRGPDGILVDIIEPIPPSAEFAASHQEESRPC
jgi:catechol 2,3-dioxygenase-like lactoylglutathione lyase family enzyme